MHTRCPITFFGWRLLALVQMFLLTDQHPDDPVFIYAITPSKIMLHLSKRLFDSLASRRSSIHLCICAAQLQFSDGGCLHLCNLFYSPPSVLTIRYSSMQLRCSKRWFCVHQCGCVLEPSDGIPGLTVELLTICCFLTNWYSSCRASRRYVFIRHICHTAFQTMPTGLQKVLVFVRRGIHYEYKIACKSFFEPMS